MRRVGNRTFVNRSTPVRFDPSISNQYKVHFRAAPHYLNWGHVEPIYKGKELKAAKLRIYAGEPEEYITFITPEAYRKLEEYIKYREQCGEKMASTSPVIRDKWVARRKNRFRDIAECGYLTV